MRDTPTEAANDWVEWKGGCCPVPPETRVELKLRDNSTHQNDAGAVRWSHTFHHREKRHRDVVAYRVLIVESDAPADLTEAERIADLLDRVPEHVESANESDSTLTKLVKLMQDWEGRGNHIATMQRMKQAAEDLEDARTTMGLPTEPLTGEWWQWKGHRRPVFFVGYNAQGQSVWDFWDKNAVVKDDAGKLIRHLPNCTGFDYVPPPEQTPAEKLADEIAEMLFTDGTGEEASRLVMEQRQDLDGPGWCRSAVANLVRDKIAAHMREREGGAK